MKKQIISGILALTMVFGSSIAPVGGKTSVLNNNACTAEAGYSVTSNNQFWACYNNYYHFKENFHTTSDGQYSYKLNKDGTVEIASYNGNSTTVSIPSTLGGRKVTAIGIYAFFNKKIKSVKIPSGVKTIGDYAFLECFSLKSINIPSGVKTIGNYAFSDCSSLESINIPDSVTTIGRDAFLDCTSLRSVTIGKSVKSIGEGSFCLTERVDDFENLCWYFKHYSNKSIKIHCYKGSYAESYAKKNGIKYEYIKALSTPTPKISNGASGVNVSWTKSSGASSYNVYKRKSGESWTKIATVDASKLSYTDKNVYSGTTYYYTVKAVSPATTSGFVSTSALKFLRMPVVKSENASNGVKVSWSKTGCSSGYYVYRRTDSTSWTKIKTLSGSNSLSYTDTTVSSGTTYYYTVRAYSGNTTSTFKSASALKFLRMPVVKAAKASNGIKVSWSKTGCSSGYYVYRKTGSTSWTKIKTLSGSNSLSYTDTTAKPGTTYYYTVRAYSGKTTSTFKSTSAVKR